MDVPPWSQQVQVANLGTRPMEEIENTRPPNNNNNSREVATSLETRSRTRPQKDENINCPRCNSINTKFCYYNNYSLTQPRFFCKTCRRYWTQGGSLRNVPVGGGSRKNKRSSSYATTPSSPPPPPPPLPPISSSTTTPPPPDNKLLLPDLNPPTSFSQLFTTSQNPHIKFLEDQDLNLAFPMQGLLFNHQLSKIEGNNNNKNENFGLPIDINGSISSNNSCITSTTPATAITTAPPLSALELLRNGIASRGSLNPFVPIPMPDSNTLYQSGYPNMQEFKPSLNIFSSQNHHNNNNIIGSNDHNNARLLFPFGDVNKLATNNTQHHDEIEHDDQSKGTNGNDHHNNHQGYWSGVLDGGTW